MISTKLFDLLMEQKSRSDVSWLGAQDLPKFWRHLQYEDRVQILRYLQKKAGPPQSWISAIPEERRAVMRHLKRVLHECGIGREVWPKDGLYNLVTFDESSTLKMSTESITDFDTFRYAPPNGGKRILPSVYTRLTDKWVTARGTWMEPREMNDGHLENTIKLLEESHRNLLERSNLVLQKVHSHVASARASLVEANELIQASMVGDVYPVYIKLKFEWAKRQRAGSWRFDNFGSEF